MADRRINATRLTDVWFRENGIKSTDGWIIPFVTAERTCHHVFYRNNPKGLRRDFADHLTKLMWYELDQLRFDMVDCASFTPSSYCARFPMGEIAGPLRQQVARLNKYHK